MIGVMQAIEGTDYDYMSLAEAIYPEYFEQKHESLYPLLQAYYKNSNKLSRETFGRYFLEDSPRFRMVVDYILMKVYGGKMDENGLAQHNAMYYDDRIEAAIRNYITSFMLKDIDMLNVSDEARAELLGIGEDNINSSLGARIADMQIKYPHLADNPGHLLSILQPLLSPADIQRSNMVEVRLLDSTRDPNLINYMTDSFSEMMNGEVTGPDGNLLPDVDQEALRQIAIDLIKYDFMARGLSFGINSFAEIIPTQVKAELGLGDHLVTKVKQLLETRAPLTQPLMEMADKFLRTQWFNGDVVPRVKRQTEKKTTKKGQQTVTKKGTGNWTPQLNGIIVTDSNLSNEPMMVQNAEYIYSPVYIRTKLGWKAKTEFLYKFVGERNGKRYYIPVSKLGIPTKIFELGDKSLVHYDPYFTIKGDARYTDVEGNPFYTSEEEAMRYVEGVLNGDIDMDKDVLELREDLQAKKSASIEAAAEKAIEVLLLKQKELLLM